jgi:hypothetical protein
MDDMYGVGKGSHQYSRWLTSLSYTISFIYKFDFWYDMQQMRNPKMFKLFMA